MPSYGYKILGQAYPLADTETLLYTVPGGAQTIVSSIVCCNLSGDEAMFNISVSVGGAATSNQDYLFYEVIIPSNETFQASMGLTMAATDVIRVYSSTGELAFSAFGSEYA